jgi:hypothetical protein
MWKNNSLSIVLFVMFVLTLGGQSYAGWASHNDEQRRHAAPEIAYSEYLRSSEFGEAVFENWESEFLQMGFYVLLTVVLIQKGSSESKQGDGSEEIDDDPRKHRNDPDAPSPVRQGGWRLMLYKNSLGLAFILFFLASFFGHAFTGALAYSEEQRAHGGGEVSMIEYLATAQFWHESFQNWQSEFLAVFSIVVLSIWLRQWGSPESKPVHAPHSKTGI